MAEILPGYIAAGVAIIINFALAAENVDE